MATVAELCAGYERFMVTPRRGGGTCERCFNLTAGYTRCYACAQIPQWLDAMAPVSYSIATEELHAALAGYKRMSGRAAERLQAELAAVLWRFLSTHEQCLANAARIEGFPLVTTIPSGYAGSDEAHPLSHIVSQLVAPVKARYDRLLEPAAGPFAARQFNPRRFETRRQLRRESVLVIDDTWTTGATAHSAAAALKAAGAGRVAAVVIGRHINRGWHENDRRLRALATGFSWRECALCSQAAEGSARPLEAAPSARGVIAQTA
jgi:hypothetical protein